jgi:hypothetical protein
VKGTRLWQAPGSPIIQGRSRNERSFWEAWAMGAASAEVLVIVLLTAWALRTPGMAFFGAVGAVFVTVLLPSLAGCMLGSAAGTAFARVVGWRRAWVAGLVLGVVLGIIAAQVL